MERSSAGEEHDPTHLDSISPLVDAGNVLVGGALLNESGDDRFDAARRVPRQGGRGRLARGDPYVTDGVWRDIEVHPFRTAVGAWQP